MQNMGLDRADLDPRHEWKYFINDADHAHLSTLLGNVLWRDPHGDEYNEYAVRSLYFDDVYDSSYYDKLSGNPTREKYRIRIYNLSDEFIYLERKRKMGDLIAKSSVRITRRLCEQLIEGRPDGLAGASPPLLQDMFREMRLKLLRPAVIVDYTREVYIHPAESVRISFDKHVRSGMFHYDIFDRYLPTVAPIDDDEMILEVKYDRYLPIYIGTLLQTVPKEFLAISKYVLCRRFHTMRE